jgi:dienelactone hydrolase
MRISYIGALALWAGSSGLAAPPLPDAVPIEAFAELPEIADAELSPDGLRIAAKMSVGGEQILVVHSLFGDVPPAALRAGNVDLNFWSWVNDNWLVVGVGDERTLYGEDIYIRRILGVSADMKKVHGIDEQRSGIEADDVIWVARDGSPKLLLSKSTGIHEVSDWYPSVFDVDVSTGKAKKIVSSVEQVWEWRADGNGTVRFGTMYRDGERRGILYRGPEGGKFQRVMLGKREERSIPEPVIFRKDGSAIAFDSGDGRDAVYEMALPSFTLGKKLFGSERYDVDRVTLNAEHDDVSAFVFTDRRRRREWLDPNFKDLHQALEKTLGAGNAYITSWSRDRKKLLLEVGDPSQAGALYYWNTDGDKMERIAWNNKVLKNRKLSPVSTVEYKARDGTAMEAVLTLPRGRVHRNLPLIVMPHGGPGARDSEGFDFWAQFLAEQGYAVIQPNYRGSTGYGKAFFDLGKGQWGLKMQDDLIDAIGWASSQGLVDPKRVCIAGASYGGYAAMRAAYRDSQHYRCSISYAGISDLKAMLRYDQNLLGKKVVDYWKIQATDFDAVSARFHAAQFGMPILISHGVLDKRVPVKQSRMLASELQKAGKPYVYVEQKKGDHHFSRSEDRLEFLKAMKAFLDQHNPA